MLDRSQLGLRFSLHWGFHGRGSQPIGHIVADRNYARLHSESGEFAIRATIEGLEKRLDPSEFARVSRSVIVRVAAIKEVRTGDNAQSALVMQSGDEIPCSKKYWNSALEKLT